MERLTFNLRSSARRDEPVAARQKRSEDAARKRPADAARARSGARERYDWDYLWMIAFTTVLFFRPQDQIPGVPVLHLAELTAIAGLTAMAARRLSAGLPVATITPEVIGVIAFGGVILLTAPFSIWPGGAVHLFTDGYIKIILIFALMVTTLTTPKRLRQMVWVMIVASAYLALRADLDYVRGVDLVEGDRVRGAVGGMFQNPNDLALNLVTFLAPALFIMLQERRTSRRIAAAGLAALMLAAIVFTKSRSGFLGLVAMSAVVGFFTIRVKPGLLVAAILAGVIAVPLLPQSFWTRMNSIVVPQEDPSGSREARLRLIQDALNAFARNPLTGVGAGQFKNDNEPGRLEPWRVSHNVWLEVAADLGIGGLLVFAFLVARAFSACLATLRAVRPRRRRKGAGTAGESATGSRASPSDEGPTMSEEDRRFILMHTRAILAGLVGWFVCAFFASVAFNWTFYYILALAVGGREFVLAHGVPRRAPAVEGGRVGLDHVARAHA